MTRNYALINKETLALICAKKSASHEYISQKTKLKIDRVERWVSPSDIALPTIRQAKLIASCLHIPFAGLYMEPNDIPVKALPKVVNRRSFPSSHSEDDSALNIAMYDLLLARDFLIAANAELGIHCVEFAPTSPKCNDPIIWAKSIRDFFEISLEKQYKSPSPRQFYLYLRNQVENKGVFIHCFTDVPIEDARGFAIYDQLYPIVGINDEDRPPAKSFSIIHEIVHLYKRESSLCNDMFNPHSKQSEEVFCNAVAGELLVPTEALAVVLKKGHYTKPYSKDIIAAIANRFSVSREVVVRRLMDTGRIGELEYHTYMDDFTRELEVEREKQRIARQNGAKSGFHKDVGLTAFDRTSPSICRALYAGFVDDIYSKRDIAHHLSISEKHIDRFLSEVSKWNN